ncbi:LuxR C-terminal-related transcriptional regulator [Streptomyces sp. NPDC087263]|uniref:LuxR C-terminal-related transcriptional regulator n=1 Tax=Streptomyces sp. NPDC087263 TaxID=3365773 RepID=UPI0037F549F4
MKHEQSGTASCNCRQSPLEHPCEAALATYREALREGRVARGEVPTCLRELHLVIDAPEAPEYAVPVPPAAAAFATAGPLEDLMARQRTALRSVQARLAAFETVYTQEQETARPSIVRLTGKAVINAALEAAVGSCRDELLTAQPGGGRPEAALAQALRRDLRALGRGVRQRTVYQHTVQTHRPTMSYIEQVTAAGARVRTLAEVVERFIICDREVAFVPVSDEESAHRVADLEPGRGVADGVLEIRDPSLVRFLARSFDQTWEHAMPVHHASSAPRNHVVASDLQRTILRAVVSGETDSVIARRLGMSRRSVAEHVRKVSVQLGSGSRAQLGYLLAGTGLLDSDD